MSHLAISLLGPFAVALDGEAVTGFVSDKARALLFYLAVEADRAHRRETLAGLLWPDYPERSARTNLSSALSKLRATIRDRDATPPYLLVTRETIQFNSGADHWVDVTAFDALVDAQRWEEAIALYQGGFLAGFSVPDSPPFEGWARVVREYLMRQMMVALDGLVAECEARRDYAGAQDAARRHLELEPWHEAAHRALMRCLALDGERGSALAQFDACCRALEQELGVEPSPQTVRLAEQIRAGQFPLPVAASLHSETAERRHNLPAQLTPLIGRKAELARIRELLVDPNCRLLTMIGPGGIGKTRLALEAASEQAYGFRHGVFYVSLAPVRSADLIVSAVARALGFASYGQDDASRGSPRQQLLRYLRGKEMLLVLDNYEHLLSPPESTDPELDPGERSDGVSLVVDILHAAPDVRILITSRARLKVPGEQLFHVSGLAYPAAGLMTLQGASVARHSAVQLFLRCARRVREGYEPADEDLAHVARICQMVQGMPLAILLAAAWMEVLSPGEIVARMDHGLAFLEVDWRSVPERHRSMLAVFDASWRMLSADERAAFARLSVFRSGFTAEAAEAVAGASLHTLRGLVHKSFLGRGKDGRYEVHELLRQYAERELDEMPGGRQEAFDLHCAYYSHWVAQRRDAFVKRGPGHVLPEMANIRAAWSWALQHSRLPEIRRSFEGILWLHEERGSEGREQRALLAQVVDLLRAASPTAENQIALGLALCCHAASLALAGLDKTASPLAQEGLSLLRKLGTGRVLAVGHILAYLGGAAADETQDKQLLERALSIAQEADGPLEACWAHNLLAWVALRHARYDQAERHWLTFLRTAKEIDHPRGVAISLRGLARVAYLRGQYARARTLEEQSLAIFRELGERGWTVQRLDALGKIALALRDLEQARARYREALSLSEELGDLAYMTSAHYGLGEVALAAGDALAVRQHYQRAVQVALEDPRVETGRKVLVSLAKLVAHCGKPALAVELGALALHVRPARWGDDLSVATTLVRDLRSALSSEDYAAAEERGCARDLEATLKELLAEFQDEP